MILYHAIPIVLLFSRADTWGTLAATAAADGVVKTDRNRRVVQHQEGGIVSDIRVRDGDRVKAGQVLVMLDDPAVRSELRKVRSMLDSELAKLARLEAERVLAKAFIVSPELSARAGDATVAEVISREQRVFTDHRNSLDAQLNLIASSVHEVDREILAVAQQVKASSAAVEHTQNLLSTNEALLKDKFIQKAHVMELQRSLSEVQMKAGEANAEIAKAKQKRLELELKAKTLTNDFSHVANNEWKLSADRVEQFRAQVEPNADAARRQSISAPVAGTVVELHVNTIGAVISPRDTVLEIVPDNAPLLVEARLRTDAIAQGTPGTDAGVQLLAFDQRTVPTLHGKVIYVSADRQLDKVSGASYYIVHVEVPDSVLKTAGIEALTPGMPAEIYFHAGKRTTLSYLLDPFSRRMQRAMREK